MPAQVSPVDELLAALDRLSPAVDIQRLRVKYPADDDNLWFVRTAARDNDVQFDCHTGGKPPFLVEGGDGERIEAASVAEAVVAIRRLLGMDPNTLQTSGQAPKRQLPSVQTRDVVIGHSVSPT